MLSKQHIDIPFWTMIRAALVVVGLIALWFLRDIVVMVLLSIVIASAIEPAARWFAKYKIPRLFGVIIVYFLALSLFVLTFYFVIPPLLGDVVDFASTLPALIEDAFRPDSSFFSALPSVPQVLKENIKDFVLSFQSIVPAISGSFASASSTIFGGVFSVIMVFVLSFYLAVQEQGIENFLRIVAPIQYEKYLIDLWRRSQRKIGLWLQGQILLGLLVGIFVFLGLTILGVKYALLLAILSALFEIIPVFGPVLAAIPAIAIAFIQSPLLGLSTLGLYVIVQQFENHLIYPLVVRKTVGVPPILVIIAILVGGNLAGIYGVILSVPLAAVFIEFLNDVATRKHRESIS